MQLRKRLKMRCLTRPVYTLYAVFCQVDIGEAIVCGSNLFGFEWADLAIGEEVISFPSPVPPPVVFSLYGCVIAEPFSDEYFS